MLDSLCVSGGKSRSKGKIKDVVDRSTEAVAPGSSSTAQKRGTQRRDDISFDKEVTEHTEGSKENGGDISYRGGLKGGDPPSELLRFQIKPTAMMIFGPPGRGKSYLLKKMFMNPPLDPDNKNPKTGEAQPAIQMIVIFTPTFKDWEDVPNASKCLRSWSIDNIRSLMQY